MLITDLPIKILNRYYSLPEILDFKLHRGFVNNVYELICKNNTRYFLREYININDTALNKINNEINILAFHQKNKSKPLLDFIVYSNDNKSYFITNNKMYVVKVCLPGTTSSFSEMNGLKRISCGEAAGHLHNSFSLFDNKTWKDYPYRENSLPILYHLKPEEIYSYKINADISSIKVSKKVSSLWNANSDLLHSYIKKYIKMRTDLNLESQPIHGDLDPTNVCFEEDNAVAFIDWDFLQISPRVLDIGNSLINRPAQIENKDVYNFDLNQVNEFLKGYSKTIKKRLSLEETKAIPFAFFHTGLQYLLAANCLFNNNLPEKKLYDFLYFRFVYQDKINKMGKDWYKDLTISCED